MDPLSNSEWDLKWRAVHRDLVSRNIPHAFDKAHAYMVATYGPRGGWPEHVFPKFAFLRALLKLQSAWRQNMFTQRNIVAALAAFVAAAASAYNASPDPISPQAIMSIVVAGVVAAGAIFFRPSEK